jgi:hypothetical protein
MVIPDKLYLRISRFMEISAEGPFAITATLAIILILATMWIV